MQRAWRMNHRPASRLEADTVPSPQAKAIRSQATLTSRSHTLTMAMHAPLSQFLARLDTDLGAGTGGEFLSPHCTFMCIHLHNVYGVRSLQAFGNVAFLLVWLT